MAPSCPKQVAIKIERINSSEPLPMDMWVESIVLAFKVE
jgi:hypothetical protein